MQPLSTLLGCLVVSALWGVTNPFLRAGAESTVHPTAPTPLQRRQRGKTVAATASHPSLYTRVIAGARVVAATLANWRFSLPFAVNQLGGVAFSALLGTADLTLVVPLVNSLTILWTAATARVMFGETERLTPARCGGAALVLAGIALCLSSRGATEEH